MNFFAAQEKARSNTLRLLLLFCLAVVGLILTCYILIGVVLSFDAETGAPGLRIDWELLVGTALIVLAVVMVGSVYKILTLRGGGKVVAEAMGGTALSPDTQDRVHRRALNVVEEIAIASGTPVPQVYIIPESGINAFAAGYSPGDAVIGLTEGTLSHLDRAELQGVVAHEFSHILNGDMRLNIRIMGVLHGILLIALIGRVLMLVRGRNAAPFILSGLGLFVAGWIGFLFGGLIKSGISRQREYLADASAVQFTRNPDGIAGALQKIGISSGQLQHPDAEQISHSLFADGALRGFWSFATHPPLDKRIRRIDPQWDGVFREQLETTSQSSSVQTQSPQSSDTASTTVVSALAVLQAIDSAGQMDAERLAHARALIERLPENVLNGIREPFSARAIVYALVIAQSGTEWYESQLAQIKEHGDQGVYDLTLDFLYIVPGLAAEDRLPLVELAAPALRMLSKAQYMRFRKNLSALIKADDVVSVFEWAIHKVLIHHLDCAFIKPAVKVLGDRTLRQVEKSCYTVFSALAAAGGVSPDDCAAALNAAVVEAGLTQRTELASLPVGEDAQNALDQAFEALSRLKGAEKERLLKACIVCVVHDDQVTVSEMELLRAFADVLGCPVPPAVLV